MYIWVLAFECLVITVKMPFKNAHRTMRGRRRLYHVPWTSGPAARRPFTRVRNPRPSDDRNNAHDYTARRILDARTRDKDAIYFQLLTMQRSFRSNKEKKKYRLYIVTYVDSFGRRRSLCVSTKDLG